MLFLNKDPHQLVEQLLVHRGTERAITTTKETPALGSHVSTGTHATNRDVTNLIPVIVAQNKEVSIPQAPPPLVPPHETQTVPPKVQVKCQINIDRLEKELSGHPDQFFVHKLCTELREGAHIGFVGERKPKTARNLPTAFQQPEKISENLANEVTLGRTAGPFDFPPFANFQISPLGIIPKKHSEKFRTIFHLSYPKTGTSINSCINKDSFSLQYVSTDQAIASIQALGKGTPMAKTDIESAFRLFPIHPDDWELLGMTWEGKYYYEKFLPFGLRSAPFLFNQLSEGIEWILRNKCGISFVCHFLDDFLIMEPPSLGPDPFLDCKASRTSMQLTFKELNVPLAPAKTVGPATRLEFLGIILDSEQMQASLPQDKVIRLQEELAKWSNRRKGTLKELQSLIGSLNFACRVIPPGRAFLQRIINLTIGIKKPYHHVRLNAAFFEDIRMWQMFLKDWNGKQFFLNTAWESSVSLQLFTDASSTIGYGGIFGRQWFQGAWENLDRQKQGLSINWKELYAIVVACHIWGSRWSQKRLLFYCDNQSVVEIINSKRSKCPAIMSLVRNLTLLTLQNNFYFKAMHIPGSKNEIADSLSRFQVERFRMLAPWANKYPQPIPKTPLLL